MATYREIVAIVALTILSIYLLLTLFIFAARRPVASRAGWYFITAFILLRISGDAITIVTNTSATQDTSLYIAGAIISAVGLSPLLLATLFFLDHVESFVRNTRKGLHYGFLGLHIPVLLALILSIVGGVQASNKISSTGLYTPNTLSKAGAVIFAASFICIAVLAVVVSVRAANHKREVDRSKVLLGWCTVAVLPFLVVRLAYALLYTFSHDSRFNLLTGNETVQLCMQVLMELAIVAVYIAYGVLVPQPKGLRPAGRESSVEEGLTGAAIVGRSEKVGGEGKGKKKTWLRYVPILHWFV